MYDHEGYASIPIPTTSNVSINKMIASLSVLEKLVSDFTFSFKIDNTPSTAMILNNVEYSKADDQNRYRAFVIDEGIKVIDGYLCINGDISNLKSGKKEINVQLIGTHQFWKEDLEQCKLCELDFGEFVWSNDNIKDLWETQEAWPLNGNGYDFYPLVANYGSWIHRPTPTNNQAIGVLARELRYLIYHRAIWEKAFCKAGYKIKSKFLNSEWYRRRASYIFRQDQKVDESCNIRVRGSNQAIEGDYKVFIFQIDSGGSYYNNGGYYSPNTGEFTGVSGIYEFCARFNINRSDNAEVDIRIVKICNGITQILGTDTLEVQTIDDNQTQEVYQNGGYLCIDPISITSDCVIRVEIKVKYADGNDPNISGSFTAEGSPVPFLNGETIKISDWIDCECSVSNWLEEESTKYALRFETDEATKTVCVEPLCGYFDNEGNYCEGFVQEGERAYDITDKIDISKAITKKRTNKNEKSGYCYYYAESDDGKVLKLEKRYGQELFSKNITTIDNGKEKTTIRLDKYQPTVNDFDDNISNIGTDGDPYIPFIWAGDFGENGTPPPIGYDTGFRDFFIYPYGTQNTNGVDSQWTFDGMHVSDIPNVAQCWNQEISITPFSGGAAITPTENAIFGDTFEKGNIVTISDRHLEKCLTEQDKAQKLELFVCLNSLDLIKISERRQITISSEDPILSRYGGTYRLESINKRIGDNKSSKMILCEVLPATICKTEDNNNQLGSCPDNLPEINCIESGNCYTFTVGGTYSSVISSITFEMKFTAAPVTSWLPIPATSLNTAQVCDPNRAFQVRACIKFESNEDGTQCPKKFVFSALKNPCGESNPELICIVTQNANGDTCIELAIGGTIVDPYTLSNFQYTIGINGQSVPYTLGNKINAPIEDVYASVTIDFDGPCDPIEIENICVVPPLEFNCDHDLLPTILTDANGCCYFECMGSLTVPTPFIEFWYLVDDGDKWQQWDGEPICNVVNNIKVQLFVKWCKGECPEWCSDIVEENIGSSNIDLPIPDPKAGK
jgi:hypothetical protein